MSPLEISSVIVTVIALLLGPVLAIQSQKWLERNAERRAKQLRIFRVLMATRSTPVTLEHAKALNLIDIDFSTKQEKEKSVIDTWQILQLHLNTGYPNYDIDKDKPEYQHALNTAINKSREYLENLLDEMSKCLGYDFERIIIKRDSYYSLSQADKDNDDFLIRKGLRQVLYGLTSVSVNVKDSPEQIPNEPE